MAIKVGDVVKINVELLKENGWEFLSELSGVVEYITSNEGKEFVVSAKFDDPKIEYNTSLEDETIGEIFFLEDELILVREVVM